MVTQPDLGFGKVGNGFNRFAAQMEVEHDGRREQRFVAPRPADDVDDLGGVQPQFVVRQMGGNVGVVPVSYTHLDVYKRQPAHLPQLPTPSATVPTEL